MIKKNTSKRKKAGFLRRNGRKLKTLLKKSNDTQIEKSKKTLQLTLNINPQKFMDPVNFFRLPTDLLILDRVRYNLDGELVGMLSTLSECKRITNVVKDKNLEIISINFENHNLIFGSEELLYERLYSVGDSNAKELANMVKKFICMGKELESKIKEPRDMPQNKNNYKEFIKEKENIIKKLNKDNKVFYIVEFVFDKILKMFQLKGINFCIRLCEIVFDNEEEMFYQLSRGIPDFITYDINKFYEFYFKLLNKSYFKSDEKLEVFIISKNLKKIRCWLDIVQNLYLEENFVEFYLIEILELTETCEIKRKNNILPIDNSKNLYQEEFNNLYSQIYKI